MQEGRCAAETNTKAKLNITILYSVIFNIFLDSKNPENIPVRKILLGVSSQSVSPQWNERELNSIVQ